MVYLDEKDQKMHANRRDLMGNGFLKYAVEHNHLDMVELLLDYKAGWCPVIFCCLLFVVIVRLTSTHIDFKY